jgi:hypothetical protein
VSQLLEVKRTLDGKVLARRKDGLPLSPEDREEAKRLAGEVPPPCWNCEATMTVSRDIYGETVFVCWRCAKSA